MKYIILLIALSISLPVMADENTAGGGGACIVCGGPVTFYGSGPGGYSNSSPIEYPLQRKLPFSIFIYFDNIKLGKK